MAVIKEGNADTGKPVVCHPICKIHAPDNDGKKETLFNVGNAEAFIGLTRGYSAGEESYRFLTNVAFVLVFGIRG